jgi:hypothetical protein
LVRAECRGMGRAVDRRVTAAVSSMRNHVTVVSGRGRGAAVTVAESVRARAGPSRAPRRDVAPSGSRAIRVLRRGGKSLVRTKCGGAGRAVDRRVTAAVSSMGSHVAVYLAVVEKPSSRSPSLFVQELGRAAHRGVAWCRVARAPSKSCVGREESGPDGVQRDGPGRGPQGHGRRALDGKPCRGVSGSGRGAAVTVTESVRAKARPSRALRCEVAPSGSGAIPVLCRDVKSLVRTGCRGTARTGRAVGRRVTAAVSSMGSHVTVYLAVVEEPQSRSPRLCV